MYENTVAGLVWLVVAGLSGLGGWCGRVTLGRQLVAFGSVGVGDEVCRLNGSKYESAVGSLCGWLTILPHKNSTRR